MPFFSVIIPTYNRASMLREALDSVFAQTFTDYEVIVVDDGSTDDTPAIVARYEDRVRFFRQENSGPGAARNLGIQNVSGEYVTFLDSDDLWFPWTLATFKRAIEQEATPALVSGTSVRIKDDQPALQREGPFRSDSFQNLLVACDGNNLPIGGTPSVAIRSEVVKRHQGFCALPINAEDLDLWLRLGEEQGFVRLLSPHVFAQRAHLGNVTNQISLQVRGVEYLISQERSGKYPGRQRKQRRRILAAVARNASLQCVRAGRLSGAFKLFRQTFLWQLWLGRFRYLMAFPFLIVGSLTKAIGKG